jgi:hypothetical protein
VSKEFKRYFVGLLVSLIGLFFLLWVIQHQIHLVTQLSLELERPLVIPVIGELLIMSCPLQLQFLSVQADVKAREEALLHGQIYFYGYLVGDNEQQILHRKNELVKLGVDAIIALLEKERALIPGVVHGSSYHTDTYLMKFYSEMPNVMLFYSKIPHVFRLLFLQIGFKVRLFLGLSFSWIEQIPYLSKLDTILLRHKVIDDQLTFWANWKIEILKI